MSRSCKQVVRTGLLEVVKDQGTESLYAPRESWLVERWTRRVSGVRRWARSFPDEGVLMLLLFFFPRRLQDFLLFTA